MIRFIARRFLVSIPVVIGVAAMVFGVMQFVPGDAADVLTADTSLSPEQVADIRRSLGLDQNVATRFVDFITGAARFDFGVSYRSGADQVSDMVRDKLPATLQLTIASVAIGALLGVTLGVLAAVWRGTWLDRGLMLVSVAGVSVPPFWLAIVLILVFGVQLGWLPVTSGTAPRTFGGMLDPSTFRGLVLPMSTLGLALAAGVARLVRSQMIEALSQDFIRTAYAKGLRRRSIVVRHALRNALIPAVSLVGVQFGNLIGGAVVIEIVFGRQGLGRLLVEAIGERDMPVVQAVVVLIAVGYVLVNMFVDVTYRILDPRIQSA